MRNILTLLTIILVLSSINGFANNFNFLKVCIKKHCFDSRVADNPSSRTKGLMNEFLLPVNEAMLFMFPFEMKPGFWMKNMNFPLDIIFINDDDIIVYIVKNAPPCKEKSCPTYTTTRAASKVLEINGGLCNKYGIHVGSKVHYFIEE